jgi:hypothetical protein
VATGVLLLAAACLLVAAHAEGHPLGLDPNQAYGILGNGFESPHVKWAKPFAGGTVRALVLAPQWSQRETVELAQRLDLDPTAWMCSSFRRVAVPAEWFMIPTPAALIDRLLRQYASGTFDVIVVGKLDWGMLPAKQRFELLRQVAEGAGLVYVCPPAGNPELALVTSRKAAPDGVAFIAKGIPFASLPQLRDLRGEKVVRAGLFGKGRVVALDYNQALPAEEDEQGRISLWRTAAYPALTPQWDHVGSYSQEISRGYIPPDECAELEFVPYEYYQSLVARAVVWASGRQPAAQVGEAELPDPVDYPATAQAAQVTTTAAPAGALLKAVVRSRYEYGRSYEVPARPAAERSSLPLPAIPAGEYILDVWLTAADGKVLDWSSRGFTVKADIEITAIGLDGRSYNPGDTVAGTASLSRPLTEREALVVELWDNHGRKLAERSLAGAGNHYTFSFTLDRPLAILHAICARAASQGHDVAVRRLAFPVRAKLKGFDDFNEIVWSGADNQFLTHLMLRKLAQADQADAIDVGWSGATHARNVALANLAAVPYTAGFGHFGSKTVPVTGTMNGCMTAPQTRNAIDEWGALQSAIYGPYGPLSWTHGDESYYAGQADTCWSDTCLAAFREFLQGRYASLDALNREWETGYKTWDDAMPLTFEEAAKTGNYAPWIEHRLAQQLVWARHYEYTGKALSVNDPHAHVGFDGNNGFNLPNGGINWWVLKDHVGELHGYVRNSEEMEVFRSFAGPGHLSGMWYGAYGPNWPIGPATVEYHHFFPWYSLLHGLNSTWFWTMGSPGNITGYAPDFTNLPFLQASRDALCDIRGGIGKLLLAGTRQDDGIAVHYSEASRLAEALTGGRTTATLEGGISLAGAAPTTEAWAERLTDFNKALEHCGLQYRYMAYEEVEEDALAARGCTVFIMPHSRAVSEKEAAAIRRFVNAGGLLLADILPGILNGHGTRQAESLLADLFPSREPGVVNRIGDGKSVLLGDMLAGYGYAAFRNMQGWGRLEGRHRVLAELLAKEAGIAARVTVVPRGQGEMPPTEVARFRSGEAEYVGLLREYFLYDHKPYPATVRFPRKAHLYDLRRGEYLGHTDSVDTELSHEAQVYALLPYRVNSVRVKGPSAAKAGEASEFALSVAVSGGKPGLHVFRFEVLGPSGEALPWYAANVRADNGRAACTIPWALNERPGQYTLLARDAATGATCRQSIGLK